MSGSKNGSPIDSAAGSPVVQPAGSIDLVRTNYLKTKTEIETEIEMGRTTATFAAISPDRPELRQTPETATHFDFERGFGMNSAKSYEMSTSGCSHEIVVAARDYSQPEPVSKLQAERQRALDTWISAQLSGDRFSVPYSDSFIEHAEVKDA
jgi:hypothetical protein